MKKKIALFTTGWCGEILSQFIEGLQKALENEPVDIFMFLSYSTYTDTDTIRRGEMNTFSLPCFSDFDGVIIFGSGLDFKEYEDSIVKRSMEANIPVIMQGRKRDGVYYIGSDNYQATKDMVKHLRDEHGVRKIVFFAGSRESYDSGLRLKAVKDYLDEIGSSNELMEVFYTNWVNLEANRRISEMCENHEEMPDAFICANDGIAMQTCVSLNDHGYRVPENILITGYDHIDDSQLFYPSIASVDQCFLEMGEKAGRVWLKLLEEPVCEMSHIIPCRFIPGDSCKCFAYRNSDEIRRQRGRDNFKNRANTTYFNWKLDAIDSTTLQSASYQELKQNLCQLFIGNHAFEGDSFHVLLEPSFGQSIHDQAVKVRSEGYSESMEVLYSIEDKKAYEGEMFESKKLIPGYTGKGKNHLYAFLSLYEGNEIYGYTVFRDPGENIENRFLYMYINRMRTVFDKFRKVVTLDLINKRLMDLMQRDPLTNVSNRMAYEDKEKSLQEKIDAGADLSFAVVMFDVNNLKQINDSNGHDAGDGYLIRTCRFICNIFKHSPVYRLGGDEFVTILIGEDYDHRSTLLGKIEDGMSRYSEELPLPEDYISIAYGMAVYTPPKDKKIQSVVRRADKEMYKKKAQMKA